MRKYEYYSVNETLTDFDLNRLGRIGWELVAHSAVASNGYFAQYYVFKRPLND